MLAKYDQKFTYCKSINPETWYNFFKLEYAEIFTFITLLFLVFLKIAKENKNKIIPLLKIK